MHYLKSLTLLLQIFVLATLASAASAQTVPDSAPRVDSTSPGGVSYGTGGFTYDFPALAIGDGEFPHSLKLVFEYRSDGAREPNTPWASNLTVRTSVNRWDPLNQETPGCPPWCHPGDYTYAYNIVSGQHSDSFHAKGPNSSGPFTPIQLNGSNLVSAGTMGNYTYTTASGAVITLGVPISGSEYNSPTSWTEPDGTQLYYNLGDTGAASRPIAAWRSSSKHPRAAERTRRFAPST